MNLEKVLEGIDVLSVDYNNINIRGITIDSRSVEKDYAFVCFEGTKFDGHNYIKDAIANGAKAIIHQKYFDLPVEYEATMWAIDYMRNNAQKVAEFWKELQEAIMEFYRLNEVEVA